jgi:hypothetical protein
MKLLASVLFTLSLGLVFPAQQAHAQDDYEDLDGESSRRNRGSRSRPQRGSRAEVLREVERGLYAKASVGLAAYLLDYSGIMRAGTALALGIGNDFVDNERSSLSAEIQLYSGIHNGMRWEQQGGVIPGNRHIQGDTRFFGALVAAEYSVYPARRLGIGLRAGGGLLYSPLLMNRDAYNAEVLPDWQRYGGQPSSIHDAVLPTVLVGPTIEYYTKLSHFSIGLDIDATYSIGFDLGVIGTGYLKYTF